MRLTICFLLVVIAIHAIEIRSPGTVERQRGGEVETGSLKLIYNGWPACDPTVTQYSGYFDINATANKHYFFWAFESRGDPMTDPVILWMTGGPGCSSGLALLVENGPCKIDGEGELHRNPYSWNSGATIIYIDQPADVGFSYSDQSGLDHNETQVGDDMYLFLQAFYSRYPKFLKNDFFVYGESYGGHFAPATAHRVWQGMQAKEGLYIPMKGLSVGNGLTDPSIQYKYYAELAYHWCKTVKGEPCITKAAYDQQTAAIPACIDLIAQCQNGTTSMCDVAQNVCGNTQMGPYFSTGLNPYDIRIPCLVPGLCYNLSSSVAFFNRMDVQEALGVASQNISWSTCSGTVNTMFSADWMKDFNQLIPDLLGSDIRVLIYAGDMDWICNWIGNKHWTVALPWSNQTAFAAAEDEPWYLDFVEAGFVRHVSSANVRMLFSFVQIHGAGHMVPMDQPHRALDMVQHFLADRPFK